MKALPKSTKYNKKYDGPYYTIDEIGKGAGVHPQTIRAFMKTQRVKSKNSIKADCRRSVKVWDQRTVDKIMEDWEVHSASSNRKSRFRKEKYMEVIQKFNHIFKIMGRV